MADISRLTVRLSLDDTDLRRQLAELSAAVEALGAATGTAASLLGALPVVRPQVAAEPASEAAPVAHETARGLALDGLRPDPDPRGEKG